MADPTALADALDDMLPCECAVCGPDDRVATLREAAATLRSLDEVRRAAAEVADVPEHAHAHGCCRMCRLTDALARVTTQVTPEATTEVGGDK